MKCNTSDLIELSLKEGDHEGRLAYKPPSKSLYESSKYRHILIFFFFIFDY